MHENVFFEFLREHGIKVMSFKKKTMKLLTKKNQKIYENVKICCICKAKFKDKCAKDKEYSKVRDHCHCTGEHRTGAYSICNLKCSVPKETHVVVRNGSNYDYDFIIKEVAEEFKGKFNWLVENTEKHITFSVTIEKKVRKFDKNGEEITKAISYRLIYWG